MYFVMELMNKFYFTALLYATKNNNIEIVTLLLSIKSINVNLQCISSSIIFK